MSKLAQRKINKYSQTQIEAFEKLKKSNGWGIIVELAQDVIKETRLESVNENLPADEYKIECLARKKAKQMFTRVFKDVEDISTIIFKSKINYG